MTDITSLLSYLWLCQFILCGPTYINFVSSYICASTEALIWLLWVSSLLLVLALLCVADPGDQQRQHFYVPKSKRLKMIWYLDEGVTLMRGEIRTFLNVFENYLSGSSVRRRISCGTHQTGAHRGGTAIRVLDTSPLLYSYATISSGATIGIGMSTTVSPAGQIAPPYDSDSYLLMIDNCCSKCVTNCRADFVGEPSPVRANINGVGGPIPVLLKGTVKWRIEDNLGRIHIFRIPGTYFAPAAPFRMFSPQHWSQETNKGLKQGLKGAWCATYEDRVTLHWGNDKYVRSIWLDPSTNVATVQTAPGCTRYQIYEAIIGSTKEHKTDLKCFNVNTVTDDECADREEDVKVRSKLPYSLNEDEPSIIGGLEKGDASGTHDPSVKGDASGTHILESHYETVFHDASAKPTETEDQDTLTPTTELLRLHYRLGHLPFSQLRSMAATGFLPKRLLQARIPKCAACMYGKATRRAWRSKAPPSKVGGGTATFPGQCVSVDQMQSPTPGLIGQLKGVPTTQRYMAATIFVDHFSRLSFVHLQRSLTSDDTVKAKRAFERYCESHGVKVMHYHADNGRFADTLFLQDIAEQRQRISYCGVNAHFQNGVAEKRIRDLQDLARTALLHATARWPRVMSNCLWPYALRAANDALISAPRRVDGRSAASVFSRTDVSPKLGSFRPFGCPTYVLTNELAAGKHIPKWFKRARVGLYLGQSPQHARSVALVLNISTGLVSPQFHVAFDDLFETVGTKEDVYEIGWLSATHFSEKSSGAKGSRGRTKPVVVDSLSQEIFPPPLLLSPQGPPPLVIPVVNEDGVPHEALLDTSEVMLEENGAGLPLLASQESASSGVRWSQRHKPSRRLQESVEQGLLCKASALEDVDGDEEYHLQVMMEDPIAFAARSSDPDTLRADQALREPDRKQFIAAMEAEVMAHHNNQHWKVIPKSAVPLGTKILPCVWAMKRKRRIASREVYKWKARLNLHGGKQEHGVNYWETYAATLSWPPIRFMLVLSLMHGWSTRQIDLTLAYPQADVECNLYMESRMGSSYRRGVEMVIVSRF